MNLKIFVTMIAACALIALSDTQHNWPSFRGPSASGIADGAAPPISWDAGAGRNLAWKTAIPGLGHSSPVIWGDRVFLTSAISSAPKLNFQSGNIDTSATAGDLSEHSWLVYCLDKRSGRILWQKTVHKGSPRIQRHVKSSYANPTPATDGRFLIAFFGSEGLYCFDLDGALLWKKDLGALEGGWSPVKGLQWGFGSSPVIYRGLVIVQCDTQNQSFIRAYHLDDGRIAWSVDRNEDTSWGTPTVLSSPKRDELIAAGTKYYKGYDPETGRELWRLADGVDVKIPTPVATGGLIFLGGGSSHARRNFFAVRAGADGEINANLSGTQDARIAWMSPLIKPHVVTPIVYRNLLYVCADNGVLTTFDAVSGDNGYRARLGQGTSFSASPVAADGRIYFASEDGDVYVVRAGPEFELLARNPVGEVIIASPAVSDRTIYIRGLKHLFAFRE